MSQFRVIASTLNVRTGPGTQTEAVGTLAGDTLVEPEDQSDDGRWYLVTSYGGATKVHGWVRASFLSPVAGMAAAEPGGEPPWLAFARRELGVHEVAGPGDNPRVLEYHAATSLHASDDSVPWCSAFANFCMQEAGVDGTRNAAARSWLNWGARLETPRLGCVTVFKRGNNPAQGHVAFYLGDGAGRIRVLGGNQSDTVSVASLPDAMLLGYRWPKNTA